MADAGIKLVAMELDLEAAFDSTEHDFIKEMLKRMNFPKSLSDSLMRHYGSVKSKVKNQDTDIFDITRGVPQGSALSGLIFILCLAPILCAIESHPALLHPPRQTVRSNSDQYASIGIKNDTWDIVIGYADDTRTVIQPIPHDFRIVSGCFAAWEGTSGLKLNEDKTKLVPIACTAEDV